jgi:hypothetical protein
MDKAIKSKNVIPMHTRSYSILVLLSITSLSLFAQADFHHAATIPLQIVWKKGETYAYELEKGAIQYWDNQEQNHAQTRQNVSLTVLDVSDKGFVMQATYNSAAYFIPDNLKAIKGFPELIEKYKDIKVQYAIAPTGQYLGILNGRVVQQMLVDIFDAAACDYEKNEMALTVLANMRCQMTTEAYITENYCQELRLLHQFYGKEYKANNYQEYDTEVANLLEPNGKPIPAKASFKADWFEDKYCAIEHTLLPDEPTMKKLTFEYFKKMSGGAMQVENTEGVALKVNDEGKYLYHQKSGWLIELYKKRTIEFESEKKVEYVKMYMLEKGTF